MTDIRQNFICIGAQKAGTTTLADIISRHPDIYIPPIKETKYFLFDEDYQKGKTFYDSYFKTLGNQKAIGEVDPDYLLFPISAQRIADTLGKDIRLIVILRNPADRAYSHYLMTKKKGLEPFEFEKALEEEKNRKHNIREQKIFAYLERGYYGKQISEFLKVFPKENFLFLTFEDDLINNKVQTIESVQNFLNVAIMPLDLNVHSNEAGEAVNEKLRDLVRRPNFAKRLLKGLLPSKEFRKSVRKFFIRKNLQKAAAPKIDEATKKRIIETYFKSDIQFTESITGLNLEKWYN
jgi:hypothetical protein